MRQRRFKSKHRRNMSSIDDSYLFFNGLDNMLSLDKRNTSFCNEDASENLQSNIIEVDDEKKE